MTLKSAYEKLTIFSNFYSQQNSNSLKKNLNCGKHLKTYDKKFQQFKIQLEKEFRKHSKLREKSFQKHKVLLNK